MFMRLSRAWFLNKYLLTDLLKRFAKLDRWTRTWVDSERQQTLQLRLPSFVITSAANDHLARFNTAFHPEILMGPPLLPSGEGASNMWRVGKQTIFLGLNVNISKTVGDTSKVVINNK